MIDQDLLLDLWKMQSCYGIPIEVCYGTVADQKEWLDRRLKGIIDIVERLDEKDRERRGSG